MMKVPEQFRIKSGPLASDESYGCNGAFLIKSPFAVQRLCVIASDGMGWEHVSVSFGPQAFRCPTWEEMCFVKDLFWDDDDCVIQYHPPKNENISFHNYCLHMWKPIGVDLPMPQKTMVGPPNEWQIKIKGS